MLNSFVVCRLSFVFDLRWDKWIFLLSLLRAVQVVSVYVFDPLIRMLPTALAAVTARRKTCVFKKSYTTTRVAVT